MRLNKYLGEAGFCSRREADKLIGEGRVTVNGETAGIGFELPEGARVEVDGAEVTPVERKGGKKHVYIALNKPVGITCTTEENVKGNIIDCVDHPRRVFPVGRLDKDSEGLILLTSNGDIVNEILRAENKHEKEYLVEVNHAVNDEFLRGMMRGVTIHGQKTLPCKAYKHNKYGFRIILTQGLNRQIRLMAAAFGQHVRQLRRIRIMNVKLGHLRPGQWRNLTDAELKGLLPDRKDW
jgi:23S rRNA pseudouridine2604 synthase